jgi:HEAT repeat protein
LKIIVLKNLASFFLFLFLNTSLFSIEKAGVATTTSPEAESNSDSSEFIRDVETSKEPESSRKKKKQAAPTSLSNDQILKKKEIIEKILKFGSNRERKEAMREVIHFPREHAEELFKAISTILANENDMGVKVFCLRTLAEVEYNKEPQNIISTLSDKNEDVKEAAISAVQRLKIEEATPDLLNFIKNQDFSKNQAITASAITALSELRNGKQAAEFLEEKFKEKSTHTNIRSAIALYFGKVKDLRAEAALIDVAIDENEEPMTRAFAVNALGKMNSQKSIPKIKSILDKINESKSKLDIKRLSNLKIYSIAALVILGDTEILKDLVSYAKDDDANVRLRAVKQLGEIDNKEVIELLEYKAQRDPSKKVQEVAKKALEDLKKRSTPTPDAGTPTFPETKK